MPIANLAEYKDALGEVAQVVSVNIGSITVVAGRPYDLWVPAVPAGVIPTTAVAPTNETIGSLGQINSEEELGIIGARFSALNPGQYIICDRLSHMGGLSTIVITEQNNASGANLPTAALTRYTSGVGVMMALTIYTQIGATGTTVTVNYTNQAGVAGRTSQAVVIGATGFREVHRMIVPGLQEGDTGVRSVEGVTFLATTGTAGNVGVTLFKPLYVVILESVSGVASGGFMTGNTFGGIPRIEDDACLYAINLTGGINAAGSGALIVTEH
jgi:hypothetical protein